jgi:hypothetical protein
VVGLGVDRTLSGRSPRRGAQNLGATGSDGAGHVGLLDETHNLAPVIEAWPARP